MRPPDGITGVVLAGGLGRRMGKVDKGLQLLHEQPMVHWVIQRFAPQVDELIINANQNLERYQAFGYPVCPDVVEGYAGPLAGLHRALTAARYPLVATVPCDSPFLPSDLIRRLHAHLTAAGAELAVAKTGAQAHPVFCLCRTTVLPGLETYLNAGGRKIDAWYASLHTVEVLFDDEAEAFQNINTTAELQDAARPA